MTPGRIRDCRDGLWVVIQSPLVSGTSRSERACDKHTLFERIGALIGPRCGTWGGKIQNGTILNLTAEVRVYAISCRPSGVGF